MSSLEPFKTLKRQCLMQNEKHSGSLIIQSLSISGCVQLGFTSAGNL